MGNHLSNEQLAELKGQLNERLEGLRTQVGEELARSENEQYIRIASGVHDAGDESVADLLSDVNLAIVDTHIVEIRDIEVSLKRIANGTYGICVDDGEDIDYARLAATPTATRCYECQVRHEQSYRQPGRTSL